MVRLALVVAGGANVLAQASTRSIARPSRSRSTKRGRFAAVPAPAPPNLLFPGAFSTSRSLALKLSALSRTRTIVWQDVRPPVSLNPIDEVDECAAAETKETDVSSFLKGVSERYKTLFVAKLQKISPTTRLEVSKIIGRPPVPEAAVATAIALQCVSPRCSRTELSLTLNVQHCDASSRAADVLVHRGSYRIARESRRRLFDRPLLGLILSGSRSKVEQPTDRCRASSRPYRSGLPVGVVDVPGGSSHRRTRRRSFVAGLYVKRATERPAQTLLRPRCCSTGGFDDQERTSTTRIDGTRPLLLPARRSSLPRIDLLLRPLPTSFSTHRLSASDASHPCDTP